MKPADMYELADMPIDAIRLAVQSGARVFVADIDGGYDSFVWIEPGKPAEITVDRSLPASWRRVLCLRHLYQTKARSDVTEPVGFTGSIELLTDRPDPALEAALDDLVPPRMRRSLTAAGFGCPEIARFFDVPAELLAVPPHAYRT